MNKSGAAQDVFISKARIIDSSSPFNNKKVDLLIKDGLISKIAPNLKEPFGSISIEGKNLMVSPGFADLHTNVQDPGFEYKEDIASALNAAAAGGFTGVLSCSTTSPCIDNKSGIEYQCKKASGHLVDFWPSGSISKKQEGKELAEMYDMHQAGAKAFYDFKSNIPDSLLLKLALLYTKPFDGIIMLHPNEHFLSSGGMVNEGPVSTVTGLQGIPDIAEVIGIQRGLKLAQYADHPVHFTSISSIEGLDLIKKAKKKGINVSCGVSVANLMFNDSVIEKFDSQYKLDPPLRNEKTRKALIDGLKNGIIDVVISDHWPQNVEGKECEFDAADYGMISLETSFSMLRSATKKVIDAEGIVEILSSNPRKILGIDVPVINEKENANLTVFQLDEVWSFDPKNSLSQSRNSAVLPDLTGKIVATVNNGSVHLNL